VKATVVYLGRDPGLAVGSRAGVTVAEIEAALERVRTDRALHRGLIDRWKRPHDGWRSRAVNREGGS
jgi:hypothetical protein